MIKKFPVMFYVWSWFTVGSYVPNLSHYIVNSNQLDV